MSTQLRDRFFALSAGAASEEEVARYRAEVAATDAEPAATLDGLGVCWHPTARHKQVRFVTAERIPAEVRDLFARPSAAAPYLAAVFVDPCELSFRTFENIVPLDRLFEAVPLDVVPSEPTELAEGVYTFRLRLGDDIRARLTRLDALGLYVPPLNANSRGGERFIFHSALLADALTGAVAKVLPERLEEGFSHVNPVFRCNRFEPGDSNFHRHLDTPYYDAGRGHVSRYTLLVYLTGGSGDPVLDLGEGGTLTDIDAFTCVLFDQRHEHEGAPYLAGRKVFLRTELIYTGTETSHDPGIGALFSKACYLTGESVFAPELARHADAYYNRVAEAHWHGLAPAAGPEPFLHKEFRGVHFVANGYDFWFPKSDTLSLTECAALALLDHFNCKLGDKAFRSMCATEVVEAEDADWIPGFLAARQHEAGRQSRPAVLPFDKTLLFPEPEEQEEYTGGACCPFHGGGGEDYVHETREWEVIELYEDAQSFAKAHIMPAPVLMLGEDVLIDPDRFLVQGDTIHVLGKKSLTPVNFAACQSGVEDAPSYINVGPRVGVAHFLVPPITFTDSGDCYHLRFDFFRNTWMIKHEQATVPVPVISYESDDEGWGRWVSAVDAQLTSGLTDGGSRSAPWWMEDFAFDEESTLAEHLMEWADELEYRDGELEEEEETDDEDGDDEEEEEEDEEEA